MTFLIIGGDSEVGSATLKHIADLGYAVTATTRREPNPGVHPGLCYLDLLDTAKWEPLPDIKAAVVCAAMARLDQCENDSETSRRVNVDGTLEVVCKLVAAGIYTIFLSSNQVFDGGHPDVSPMTPPCPVSEYGRQKAETETAIVEMIESGKPVSILRLSKILSPGKNIFAEWERALSQRHPIYAFSDMYVAPTPVRYAAQAILTLMLLRDPGIYQISGPLDISYADAAKWIVERANLIWKDDHSHLLHIRSAADKPTLPRGIVARHTTLENSFDLVVPPAKIAIEQTLFHRL